MQLASEFDPKGLFQQRGSSSEERLTAGVRETKNINEGYLCSTVASAFESGAKQTSTKVKLRSEKISEKCELPRGSSAMCHLR